MHTCAKYDFDNKETLKEIAKRDKHSFIEGACTEHIFYEDLFKSRILEKLNNAYYSTGWWRVKLRNNPEYVLLNASINKPNDKDLHIGKLFNNHQVYYLFLDCDNEITVYHLNTNKNMSLDDFMSKNKLKFYNDFEASLDTRNSDRQENAIQFLEKNNLLKEYAFQRFFVNFILGKNISDLLNIDAIVLYEKDGQTLAKAIEIKFKYESKSGYFGLNKGFNGLFETILSYDIPVTHYILYNGTKDENVSIIDAISDDTIKSQCHWIYSNIEKDLLDKNFQTAPSKTRYDGGSSHQKYSTIHKNKFKLIKELEYEYNL